ncbi:hypothetical protein HZH68_013320 [Vespula germanica]|uniref:Uncharacterized protein n=1 Tax=Vespula germanica TaxID=30212 RepID=A0A834JCL9_VESGE|nr:hypothetical protein HZH68_013320 [Vespula germanica]
MVFGNSPSDPDHKLYAFSRKAYAHVLGAIASATPPPPSPPPSPSPSPPPPPPPSPPTLPLLLYLYLLSSTLFLTLPFPTLFTVWQIRWSWKKQKASTD